MKCEFIYFKKEGEKERKHKTNKVSQYFFLDLFAHLLSILRLAFIWWVCRFFFNFFFHIIILESICVTKCQQCNFKDYQLYIVLHFVGLSKLISGSGYIYLHCFGWYTVQFRQMERKKESRRLGNWLHQNPKWCHHIIIRHIKFKKSIVVGCQFMHLNAKLCKICLLTHMSNARRQTLSSSVTYT